MASCFVKVQGMSQSFKVCLLVARVCCWFCHCLLKKSGESIITNPSKVTFFTRDNKTNRMQIMQAWLLRLLSFEGPLLILLALTSIFVIKGD